jgi:hypothetical protein
MGFDLEGWSTIREERSSRALHGSQSKVVPLGRKLSTSS